MVTHPYARLSQLNVHSLHPTLTAELGPIHRVLGATVMTELRQLPHGVIHLINCPGIIAEDRERDISTAWQNVCETRRLKSRFV